MLLFSSPFFFFSFFLTLFLFFPFILFQCIMMVKFLGLFEKKKSKVKPKTTPPKTIQTMPNGFFAFRSLSQGLLLTSLPKQTARLAT